MNVKEFGEPITINTKIALWLTLLFEDESNPCIPITRCKMTFGLLSWNESGKAPFFELWDSVSDFRVVNDSLLKIMLVSRAPDVLPIMDTKLLLRIRYKGENIYELEIPVTVFPKGQAR